jgi:hypothetical protein
MHECVVVGCKKLYAPGRNGWKHPPRKVSGLKDHSSLKPGYSANDLVCNKHYLQINRAWAAAHSNDSITTNSNQKENDVEDDDSAADKENRPIGSTTNGGAVNNNGTDSIHQSKLSKRTMSVLKHVNKAAAKLSAASAQSLPIVGESIRALVQSFIGRCETVDVLQARVNATQTMMGAGQ